eukprot:2053572-Alexandrium_andersonii.AAC.1
MSASLVGSEMCIRHSNSSLPCAELSKTKFIVLQTAFQEARQTTNPVSYTHLTLPTICSV